MNTDEALQVLEGELAGYRDQPYAELARRVQSGPVVRECQGRSGASYQMEVECDWDDRPGGNIRVMASIDDGGWRAFVPLTRSFIKSADGSFVGE